MLEGPTEVLTVMAKTNILGGNAKWLLTRFMNLKEWTSHKE
jgi:hypothetical protein